MAAPVTIGLDVGSVSVRAAQVAHGKGRPTIDAYGQVALPDGAVSGGIVKDGKAVTAALKVLWSEQKLSSKSVRLGVSHQQVVVREVEIANLPPKDRKQALPHQVRDVVPLPVEQAILDFHPLEDADKKDTVRGILVAVPKEPVLDTVAAVERAGLHVEKVDLACFAILRAVATRTTGAEAIIDIGASGTLLVVHQGGTPQVVRTIPRGGGEITRLLSNRLNLSHAEAESLKTMLGDGGGTDDDTLRRDARAALEDALRPLLSEIRSSLNFYVNGAPGRTVDRVSLVGRASQLPGLADQLRRATDLPVHTGDPLQYVGSGRHRARRDDLFAFRPAAAVSVGLTLGAA